MAFWSSFSAVGWVNDAKFRPKTLDFKQSQPIHIALNSINGHLVMAHAKIVQKSKGYNYNDIYTFHSLFITSCSTFRLIKAFIKKIFPSMSHSLHTAYVHHFECFLLWKTLSRRHDVGFPASQRHNIIYNDITPNPSKGSNQSRLNLIDTAIKFHQNIFIISNWVVVRTRIIWKMR